MNYYDREEISNSDLKLINKSLDHYLKKKELIETQAIIEGRAFHCYLLEPQKFNDEFVIKPDGLSLATKEGQKWKKENENRQIITATWFENAKKSIFDHPLSGLLDGEYEKEVIFEYKDTNCRAKLDVWNTMANLIIDVKTISDCSKAENSVEYEYASQAYFYKKAIELTENTVPDFYFVFVEKSMPYGVKWICPSDLTIQKGEEFINKNICKLKKGGYTGYSEGLIYV